MDHRFKHHPPQDAETIQCHETVRRVIDEAAGDIEALVPEGRERSIATRKLEEAMMWANAGIARGRA